MTFSRNGALNTHHDALVGEVIEASTTEFLAQACQLDGAPPFGSFVQVADDDGLTIIGVVANVETAGIDPGARAIMRGHGDVRDELIYQENPDLPFVLRTTFRVLVVGFAEHGSVFQFLPARPARLHYSVFPCSASAVRTFTDVGLDYLAALLGCPEVPNDELLAANIRLTSTQRGELASFPSVAGRELAQLLRADYIRLSAILKRVAPVE
jgi:HAS barrel domain